MATIEGYQYANRGISIDLGAVTVGNSTDTVKCIGAVEVSFSVTVASIGTSVDLKLESSVDNTNFAHWDADLNDWQVTANGTFTLLHEYCQSAPYVKFTWVSAVGGSPTMSVIARVGQTRR